MYSDKSGIRLELKNRKIAKKSPPKFRKLINTILNIYGSKKKLQFVRKYI